ncbi:MAG: hypothetical protein MK194_00585 [Roseibacillus sp.]|nr:hypothetical protein [Roseibacillus sp.]
MSPPKPQSQVRLGTFRAACWMLAVVAFVELVAVGVALALRNDDAHSPAVVERVVTEYVPMSLPPVEVQPTPAPVPSPVPSSAPPIPKAFTNESELLSSPAGRLRTTPTLKAPFINDPEVERLVNEARVARVKNDIGAAVLKLEAAEERAPAEPNVLYQFAEVFGAVGHYEKAADYYQKVFNLGPVEAGALYELASHKLSVGFEQAQKMEGKMTLGRIRHFQDKRVDSGERIILSIPILAAPGQEIDDSKLSIEVTFYDKRNGKIHQATSDSELSHKWLTAPLNWNDSGEELLQYTYVIPPGDERDIHLLGEREHFGQVVELRYNGELLDHQAWPRTLAKQRNVQEVSPLFIPPEFLPEKLNNANPLLPPLPR